MKLIAESERKGYCPVCGEEVTEVHRTEYEDGYCYEITDCKCGAQVEQVYSLRYEYTNTNAWKVEEE